MCVNTIFKTGKNIAMYIDNINNKKFIDNRCKIQKNLEIDNTGIADNSTDLTAARNEYNILKQNNRICYPDSLDISGLSVSYGRKNIINNLNITLYSGEFTALIGNNGCGKSTLIKAVMNLIPHKGKCVLRFSSDKTTPENTATFAQVITEKLTPKKRAMYMTYIAQHSGISSSISVMDVCLMGYNHMLNPLAVPDSSMRCNVLKALEYVGLKDRAEDDFLSLSAGQKQMCILARSVIQNSPVMILDEPESALDITNRYEMLRTIREQADTNKCVLMSIHSPELALMYCDRLLFMKSGSIVDDIYVKDTDVSRLNEAFAKVYDNVCVGVYESTDNRKHYCIYPKI